jgi:hypothetical protein
MHITASMKKEIGASESAQVRKEVPVPKNEMPWLLLVFSPSTRFKALQSNTISQELERKQTTEESTRSVFVPQAGRRTRLDHQNTQMAR